MAAWDSMLLADMYCVQAACLAAGDSLEKLSEWRPAVVRYAFLGFYAMPMPWIDCADGSRLSLSQCPTSISAGEPGTYCLD